MINILKSLRVEKMALSSSNALQRLEELMQRLRAPNGCAWDRKQTFRSLIPHLIEEVYEVVEAVETGEDLNRNLREELGDLLLHVVFYSQIATEEERFTLTDVIHGVIEKMIRRHPHVFGATQADTAEEAYQSWEKIKRAEKQARKPLHSKALISIFEGLSNKLPALLLAEKVQKKMAKVGFDWENTDGVVAKIREEIDELTEAWKQQEHDAIEEEFGDLLFGLVNLARHLHLNPEIALRRSTLKCQNRFRTIEHHLHQEGGDVQDATLEQLDHLWELSKTSDSTLTSHGNHED